VGSGVGAASEEPLTLILGRLDASVATVSEGDELDGVGESTVMDGNEEPESPDES